MPIVIDTSLAIKWVTAENFSANARALRDRHLRTNDPIYVPPLLLYEGTNVLYDFVKYRGTFTWAEAEQALDDIISVVNIVNLSATDTLLLKQGMRLASQADKKDTFDSHFLALARVLQLNLWTADGRYAKKWQAAGDVRLIDTYPLS